MNAKIAILPGDGVGPEIVAEAVKVLNAVAQLFGHHFDLVEHPVGGAAHDLCGDCLPEETLAACKKADAVLLGAAQIQAVSALNLLSIISPLVDFHLFCLILSGDAQHGRRRKELRHCQQRFFIHLHFLQSFFILFQILKYRLVELHADHRGNRESKQHNKG